MSGGKRSVSGCALAFLLVTLFPRVSAGETVQWSETFRAGRLDPALWQPTAEGDCRHCAVFIAGDDARDHRLRISLDTRGTLDTTVKFAGVRGRRPIHLTPGTQISVVLDWNGQVNGSYLSAELILSPHQTRRNPIRAPEWLSIGYVGVPPGQNARMAINLAGNGRERTLYREGWPEASRTGRKIARQEITIEILHPMTFKVRENARLVYESTPHRLPFGKAYLYLQVSSHSNYPNRSIDFDDIRVSDLRGERLK